MSYDCRKQFGKFPLNMHEEHEKVGQLQCFKINEDGYCDWCKQKYTKENLWYTPLSYTWICNWCREIRELEFQITDIAKDRHEVNKFKGYYWELYPYDIKNSSGD